MLLASTDMDEVKRVKKLLTYEFEMKDLGVVRKILGMEIPRDKSIGKLFVSWKCYLLKVLKSLA